MSRTKKVKAECTTLDKIDGPINLSLMDRDSIRGYLDEVVNSLVFLSIDGKSVGIWKTDDKFNWKLIDEPLTAHPVEDSLRDIIKSIRMSLIL